MAFFIRYPRLGDGTAPKQLRPEIAEQIAEDHEHGRVGGVPEATVDVEDAQVEKADGHLVAQQREDVRGGADEDPFLVFLTQVSWEIPRVKAHAVAGVPAGEDAIGDDDRECQEGNVVVPTGGVIYAEAGVHAESDEDDGENGAGDGGGNQLVGAGRDPGGDTVRRHDGGCLVYWDHTAGQTEAISLRRREAVRCNIRGTVREIILDKSILKRRLMARAIRLMISLILLLRSRALVRLEALHYSSSKVAGLQMGGTGLSLGERVSMIPRKVLSLAIMSWSEGA